MFKLVDNKSDAYNTKVIEFEGIYNSPLSNVRFMKYPTDNCQFGCLCPANQFIKKSEQKEGLKQGLIKLYEETLVPMLLIDIKDYEISKFSGEKIDYKDENYDKIKEVISEDFILINHPYISSNKNGMRLMMIKLKEFYDSNKENK
jgi:hypothetical protein